MYFKDHYLEYRRSSQTFEADTLEKFQKHRIKKVYIKPADEGAYLAYLDEALNELSSAEVSLESRSEFAADTLQSEAENIEKNLDTEEGFNASKNRIAKVVDFIASDAASISAMLAAAGISVDNSQHSSTVASLSVALANRAGLKDKEELLSMSLASMIHDNGLKTLTLDPAVLPEDLPKNKLQDYRKHPMVSVELVAGKKYITPRVLKLIADHHEVGHGIGFPDKKIFRKLGISSQAFNLADAFDHYCMSKKLAPKDALAGFKELRKEWFEEKQFAWLEATLKG